MLAYARGLAALAPGHRFCGWCGAETVVTARPATRAIARLAAASTFRAPIPP